MEQWLFVNKTSGSDHLSRSVQREKFLIHCHVQGRWRRRRTRENNKIQQRSEAEAESSFDRGQHESGTLEANLLYQNSIGDLPHSHEPIRASNTIEKQADGDLLPQHSIANRRPLTSLQISLPRTSLDTADPFEAFPIHLDVKVSQLLGRYQLIFHNIMWCNPPAGSRARCCIGVGSFLHECFTSPAAMYSTLASMSIYMKQSLPQEETALYHQRAVAELRQTLNGQLSDAKVDKLVFVACLLWFVEASHSNLSASCVHVRGAKALIDLRPRSISPEIVNLVQKLAVQTAWTMIQSSRGNAKERIPVLLPGGGEQLAPVRSTLLTSRYRELLGFDMQVAIEGVADFINLFEQTYLAGIELDSATCRQLYLQNEVTDSKLFSAAASTPQGRVIALAVRIWKAYIFPRTGYSFPAIVLANDLADLLQQHPLSLWERHIDALMWVYTIGAMTSAHVNTLASDSGQHAMSREEAEHYFLSGIAAILRREDAQLLYSRHDNVLSTDGLCNFSRQFLYLDCVQRRILHLLSVKIRRTVAPSDPAHDQG
ncbi:hypothetical protein PV04_03525 [Phialophora macrospora]|uniref:Transcription factor domain-containing protein n=1 Tax=Phialophora macrospora TaxID=1851006 RepID=A0A0D2GGG3_9EURO|nr:hypothetical protein PV04_03525 [Phialophora macrospora]